MLPTLFLETMSLTEPGAGLAGQQAARICFCFPSAGITGVFHYAQPNMVTGESNSGPRIYSACYLAEPSPQPSFYIETQSHKVAQVGLKGLELSLSLPQPLK